ncbi:GNAT family acetyltraansferase [Staphylococcus schleiferi]|uniref:GNAT family N-acetyltransferase n=1 Tax=Staphylococcus TaxID=1279 RepID=UPI000679ED81|nr:GNAT family N-acetyltransferase [Staphylococcus coagulans]AKS67738.1 GNAT family acetyltraansferase [Staphylococcus schleiferi]AKS69912.1 GNAT family acetyltraansferase [Staphylococcus schleiferi]AKS72031.1 GNAT family acetyltraansferase [Staphylococcus schleiferi]AKS74318.1 GNAT family acetyltraansferase [Staphylococcus schleiferi]MBA8764011.1 GNAT family N-acetyltransferase [Staphylococcus coagulans]
MLLLKPKNHHYIHQVASIHVQMLYEQRHSNKKAVSQMEIALYEEMIERRLRYTQDWLGVMRGDDDRVQAYGWAHFDSTSQTVTIESLYVAPAYRQQGYAEQLKKEIEQWAIKQEAHQLIGTVDKNNEAMIALNQKLGYQVEKYTMVKNLEH